LISRSEFCDLFGPLAPASDSALDQALRDWTALADVIVSEDCHYFLARSDPAPPAVSSTSDDLAAEVTAPLAADSSSFTSSIT